MVIARGRMLLARMPAPGWMMFALVAGFAAGLAVADRPGVIAAAQLIGGIWLDGLRMTIVPLIFALVVTSVAGLVIAHDGEGARLGRRLPLWLLGLLTLSALLGAVLSPLLLGLFPIAPGTLAALREAFPVTPPPATPGMVETIRAMIPTNVVASAATGAIVPLLIFGLLLGLALGRIDRPRAESLLQPLRAIADAMIVVVGWVLRAAPIGIFALALVVGAAAGTAAVGILAQYVVASALLSSLVIAVCYAVARVFGGVPLLRFARAIAPAQAVAASTQSSIATLPAMLASAARIGVPERDAAMTLSTAVAVFKVTGPSNIFMFALTLAWMADVPISPMQIALAIPLTILSSFAILGMPTVSSYASTAPTVLVLGAPLELLPILIAIDVIPDMFRTVANVTADVAVAAAVAPPESFTGDQSGSANT